MSNTKLHALRAVIDLSYERDEDNDGGYVAEVGSGLLARNAAEQLTAAGYEACPSQDDEGRWYVLVN